MKPAIRVLLLVQAWVSFGLVVEGFALYHRIESRAVKLQQQAEVEKQRAVERERAIGDRNLHQAETFIRMCLDPSLKYAYLGELVIECRATVTKYKLYL